jgi:hypothetical protein
MFPVHAAPSPFCKIHYSGERRHHNSVTSALCEAVKKIVLRDDVFFSTRSHRGTRKRFRNQTRFDMISRLFIDSRRVLVVGALAALVATTVGAASPAIAAFRAHGGGFASHAGFGGFSSHAGFSGFHHFGPRFHDRFAFAGFGFAPGYDYYYGDYGYDGGCWRRVWGPYGWRVVNVCY